MDFFFCIVTAYYPYWISENCQKTEMHQSFPTLTIDAGIQIAGVESDSCEKMGVWDIGWKLVSELVSLNVNYLVLGMRL